MFRHLFPALFLFLLTFSFSPLLAERIFLPENTLLYADRELTKQVAYLRSGMEAEVQQQAPGRLARHPFVHCFPLYQVKMQDGNLFWASPGHRVDPASATRVFDADLSMEFTGLCLLIGGTVLLALFFRGKEKREKLLYGIPGIVILQAGITLYLAGHSHLILMPVDESGYFRAAYGMAHGEWKGPWSYTIGWPLVMVPAILLTGAENYLQIEKVMTILNAFLFIPGILILFFLILRRFVSGKKAMMTLLFWQGLSLILHYRDLWTGEGPEAAGKFISWTALPDASFTYHLYNEFVRFGWNGNSDTFAMFLVFLLFFLALKIRGGIIPVLCFSMLLGFACLVRMNNILYAPLFAWILWNNMRPSLKSEKEYGQYFLAGVFGFFLLFGLQFAVNRYQFGSMFTTPYSLHGVDVDKGFTVKYIPKNLPFLLTVLYPWLIPALAGFWFLNERKLRTGFLLWILPVMVFFSGFVGLSNSAARFLLPVFPAFAAGIVLSDLWKEEYSLAFRRLFAVILLSQVILTTPSNYSFTAFRALNLHLVPYGQTIALILNIMVPVILLILVFLFLRKNRKELLIAGGFILFYASGCIWLIAVLMLFLAVRTFTDLKILLKKHLICGKP